MTRQPADKQEPHSKKRKTPIGRPFKKGQSGNPKGRPPLGLSVAEFVRRIGDNTIQTRKGQLTRLEAVITRLYDAAQRGNVRAAELLFDRGWGKSIQFVADWRAEAQDLLRQGKITPEQLEKEIPPELVTGLFESAGIRTTVAREDTPPRAPE